MSLLLFIMQVCATLSNSAQLRVTPGNSEDASIGELSALIDNKEAAPSYRPFRFPRNG